CRCRIKAPDFPSQLGQINGITSLPHRVVESDAGSATPHCIYEKGVRPSIDLRGWVQIEAIPIIGFQGRLAPQDQLFPSINFAGTNPFGFEICGVCIHDILQLPGWMSEIELRSDDIAKLRIEVIFGLLCPGGLAYQESEKQKSASTHCCSVCL